MIGRLSVLEVLGRVLPQKDSFMQTTTAPPEELTRPTDWIFIDGNLIRADEASLPLQHPALQHGWGCFTSLTLIDGQPTFWLEHRQRLIQQSHAMGLPTPAVRWRSFEPLLLTSKADCGRYRMKILHVWPDVLYAWCQPMAETPTSVPVCTMPMEPWIDRPVFKELAYGRRLALRAQARSRGCDEAIAVDEVGRCCGATCHAVMGIDAHGLYLPRSAEGSISAAAVQTAALQLGWDVFHGPIPPGVPLLLSNAVRGLLLVSSIDGQPLEPSDRFPPLHEAFGRLFRPQDILEEDLTNGSPLS